MFPGVQRVFGGTIDEIGAWQIAFTCPERDKALTSSCIVHQFNDTALRRGERTGAQAFLQGHAIDLQRLHVHKGKREQNPIRFSVRTFD